MQTQTVKLGPAFFINELKVYRDFALAFFRENFQNSVDAGSRNIHVSIIDVSDSITRVVFEDDGCGMDRATLTNVYYVLGETTKNWNGNTNVGGYGKARILCCFAQQSYELHTGNLLVKGSGAEYTIEDVKEFHQGVKLTVDVIVNRNGYKVDLLDKLKTYLAYSYISPCKVFVNGEKWNTWTYNRNHKRSLSFGEVYTNNSQSPGIIVRVNGTLMFRRYSSTPTQVIVEITPEMSRKVLLANRDSLADEYQDELDSFVTELQIDKVSAFRPKKNKSHPFIGEYGSFTIKRKSKKDNIFDISHTITRFPFKNEAAFIPTQGELIAHNTSSEATTYDCTEVSGIFDILVDDQDVMNPKVRAVIERYYPSNWDFTGEKHWTRDGYKMLRQGVTIYKFLKMWKIACEEILSILVNDFSVAPEEIGWGVGFVFSDYVEAMHKEINGKHYLLINPVDNDGNMKFSITKKDDLVRLITIALHENAHVIYSSHDENFAGLMTQLTAKVMARLQNIINLMKEEKDGV